MILALLLAVISIDIFFRDTKNSASLGFGGNPFASDTLSYRFPAFSDFHSVHFCTPAAFSMNEDGFVYSLKYFPNETSKIK